MGESEARMTAYRIWKRDKTVNEMKITVAAANLATNGTWDERRGTSEAVTPLAALRMLENGHWLQTRLAWFSIRRDR